MHSSHHTPISNNKVTFNYRHKIGDGGFGSVYSGTNQLTGEYVAIKRESKENGSSQLFNEAKILRIVGGMPGFPSLKYFGTEGSYNILAMSRLGKNVLNLFKLCGNHFSLKTCLILADQMLCRLELIHNHGIIHRDIKPENILIGRNSSQSTFYLIDFGLAKFIRDPETGKRHSFHKHCPLVGTLRYASINSHLSYELSPRDDLESLAYVLIYLMKGSLPWQGISSPDKFTKSEKVGQMKQTISPEELCEDLPSEFVQFLTLVRNLRFDQDPDYSYYRNIFRDLFIQEKFIYDSKFEWTEKEHVHQKIPHCHCAPIIITPKICVSNNTNALFMNLSCF